MSCKLSHWDVLKYGQRTHGSPFAMLKIMFLAGEMYSCKRGLVVP